MKDHFWKKTSKVFFLFFLIYLFTTPLYCLTLTSADKGLILSQGAPLGFAFPLGYIHSVEQTPVETEYRVSGGILWQWEERTKSHNAGLPTASPRRGRFIMGTKWMIVRGGGEAIQTLRYRVGDRTLGKNFLLLGEGRKVKLFDRFPGARLNFEVKKTSYGEKIISFLF